MSISAPAPASVPATVGPTLGAVSSAASTAGQASRQEVGDSIQLQQAAIAGRTIQAAVGVDYNLAKSASQQTASA